MFLIGLQLSLQGNRSDSNVTVNYEKNNEKKRKEMRFQVFQKTEHTIAFDVTETR